MRLKRLVCVAALMGFGAVGSALAGGITYDASGSFGDGASFGGTIEIDSSGVIQSGGIDLTVTGGKAGSPGFVFDTLDFASQFGPDGNGDNIWVMDFPDSADNNTDLQLEIAIGANTTPAGFTGTASSGVDSICLEGTGNCGAYIPVTISTDSTRL